MNAALYVRILRNGLLPFIEEKFDDNRECRFQQDNDPKHTSRLVRQFLDDSNIHWWKTPAESPDLNPFQRCSTPYVRTLTN